MKLAFSYKNNFFGTVLGLTVAGHLTAFAVGSVYAPAPQFAVEQAQSSVAVQIVESWSEPAAPEVVIPPLDSVITTEAEEVAPEVAQEETLPDEVKSEVNPAAKIDSKEEKTVEEIITKPEVGARIEAAPDVRQNRSPVYPTLARERGWEGTVYLSVRVAANGVPLSVEIYQSSGHRALDQAAERAVRKWRFVPARIGNMNLESTVQIPIRFLLEN